MSFYANGSRDLSDNIEPAADSFDPENPPGNRMRCIVEDGRLLIGIPSGSNELIRWLGVFSVVMLAAGGALACYFITQDELGIDQVVVLIWVLLGFLSAFCLWIPARFKTTFVVFDRDHVLLKSSLFGIVWCREYALGGFSKAKLVLAHTRNGEPIYGVSIATLDEQRPQLGNFLCQKEKEWLVRRINLFLGRDDGLVFGSYSEPIPPGANLELVGKFEFFED